MQTRIVLVGKSAIDKRFVSVYLRNHYKFTTFRMMDGVKKLFSVFYRGEFKSSRPQRRNEYYDALYKVDNDIFIKYLDYRLVRTEKNVIVDDVRYVHEVRKLKEMGFTIVRIIPAKSRYVTGIANAAPGTSLVFEHFPANKASGYEVDLTLSFTNREAMRRQLDLYMSNLNIPQVMVYTFTKPR